MDDIWIISWFNHTAFDANAIWKSLIKIIFNAEVTSCCDGSCSCCVIVSMEFIVLIG